MSRVGKKIIQIPDKVKFGIKENLVSIKGPKGSLDQKLHPAISLVVNDNSIKVNTDTKNRKKVALQGLYRSLIANMIVGVVDGYEKTLVLSGVGFRAEVKGKILELIVGYSNPVKFELPEGIFADVQAKTKIKLTGINKNILGQTAADIRAIRPPEPYKSKGIMYENERMVKKESKKAKKE